MTILIDGGMGQELRRRGHNPDAGALGQALLDSPDVVRGLHREFIDAGAEVITTWNYAVTPHRLGRAGHEAGRLERLTRIAVDLAADARAGSGVRVAGSLPPLRASYEPNRQDPATMVGEYATIAGHLAAGDGVDLFLCETMSSAAEAVAAVRAAADHDRPIWVALTVRDEADGRLRSGEPIETAVTALDGLPVDAVLVNCCDVDAISATLPRLRNATDLPIGAYGNAFTPIDKDWTRDGVQLRDLRELTAEDYADVVEDWVAAGAGIVGGCCGIGPDHVALLRARLDDDTPSSG